MSTAPELEPPSRREQELEALSTLARDRNAFQDGARSLDRVPRYVETLERWKSRR